MGSITIDAQLMEAAEIYPFEKVQVVDINNGARLWTYAIEGKRSSGTICLNGAAARLINKGDIIIIISYITLGEDKVSSHKPKIVFVDKDNHLQRVEEYNRIYDVC